MFLDPAFIIWNFLFDCITCADNTAVLNQKKKTRRQDFSYFKGKTDTHIHLPFVVYLNSVLELVTVIGSILVCAKGACGILDAECWNRF
jgi:hypothetical protein